MPIKDLHIANFYADGFYGSDGNHHDDALVQFWHNPPQQPNKDQGSDQDNWAAAPAAEFPSYSFSVQRGATVGVDFPVHGLPVALGALGAQTATGSVSLKHAVTYGVSARDLETKVRVWAYQNRLFLRQFEPQYTSAVKDGFFGLYQQQIWDLRYSYLRVVTRVYLVDGVAVSLANAEAVSAQATVGSPDTQPIVYPEAPSAPATAAPTSQRSSNEGHSSQNNSANDAKPTDSENSHIPAIKYRSTPINRSSSLLIADTTTVAPAGDKTNATNPVNDIEKAVPKIGGSVSIKRNTSLSVSLNDDFGKHLVVGYVAFDIPILDQGHLGTKRVDTVTRLNHGALSTGAGYVRTWLETDPQARPLLERWRQTSQLWLKSYCRQDSDVDMAELLRRIYLDWALRYFPFYPTNLENKIIAEVIEHPDKAAIISPDLVLDVEHDALIDYSDPTATSTTKPTTLPTTLPTTQSSPLDSQGKQFRDLILRGRRSRPDNPFQSID